MAVTGGGGCRQLTFPVEGAEGVSDGGTPPPPLRLGSRPATPPPAGLQSLPRVPAWQCCGGGRGGCRRCCRLRRLTRAGRPGGRGRRLVIAHFEGGRQPAAAAAGPPTPPPPHLNPPWCRLFGWVDVFSSAPSPPYIHTLPATGATDPPGYSAWPTCPHSRATMPLVGAAHPPLHRCADAAQTPVTRIRPIAEDHHVG